MIGKVVECVEGFGIGGVVDYVCWCCLQLGGCIGDIECFVVGCFVQVVYYVYQCFGIFRCIVDVM